MAQRRPLTDLPFDTVERAFDLLVSDPHPLALDCSPIVGLPDRVVPLGELKSRLLHPATGYDTRDAVIGRLVGLAKHHGGRWTVGLTGVLLPGLRRTAWPLTQACPAQRADIEAATLAAFLAAVAEADPGRERLAARLSWLARSGANRVLRAELGEQARPASDPVSAAPPRPWGHPDLVLAAAVRAGVIDQRDAELIGATRLGGTDLADAAQALGVSYKACHQRRRRAEAALAAWVTSPDYPGGFVEPGAGAACSCRGGRPRHGRTPGR